MPQKLQRFQPSWLSHSQVEKSYDKFVRPQWIVKFYRSKAWKVTRLEVLREQPFCEVCLAKNPPEHTLADTVHHIRELEDYPHLALVRSNLQSVDRTCHNHIRNKEESVDT